MSLTVHVKTRQTYQVLLLLSSFIDLMKGQLTIIFSLFFFAILKSGMSLFSTAKLLTAGLLFNFQNSVEMLFS